MSHGEALSLTAAVFRTEKTNARTPGVNPGDPPTVLAGEQRVNGIELSASGRLSERWTAFGAYAFMHSDIAASNTAAELDNALALTPEHTLSFGRRSSCRGTCRSAAARSTWTPFSATRPTRQSCPATG